MHRSELCGVRNVLVWKLLVPRHHPIREKLFLNHLMVSTLYASLLQGYIIDTMFVFKKKFSKWGGMVADRVVLVRYLLRAGCPRLSICKRGEVVQEETWHEIEGFPNYLVSEQGRVINRLTSRMIKQVANASGYLTVSISQGGSRVKTLPVAKLVWMAFGKQEIGSNVIRHRDGDKTNNSIRNLYLTRLTKTPIRVKNIDTGEEFESISDAARSVGEPTSRFSFAIRQPGGSVSGYRFEIVEN